MNFVDILDRPIAFQRPFVAIGAGITGALMLSQAVYWARRNSNEHGWFFKTQVEWEEETGLGRAEQETARKRLLGLEVLEEDRKGIPAKLFYRVNPPCQDSCHLSVPRKIGAAMKDEDETNTLHSRATAMGAGADAGATQSLGGRAGQGIRCDFSDAAFMAKSSQGARRRHAR